MRLFWYPCAAATLLVAAVLARDAWADVLVLTPAGQRNQHEIARRIKPAPILKRTDGLPFLRGRIVREYPDDRTRPLVDPARHGQVQVLVWGLNGEDPTPDVVLLPKNWLYPVDEINSIADLRAAFGDLDRALGIPLGSPAWRAVPRWPSSLLSTEPVCGRSRSLLLEAWPRSLWPA